MVNVFIDGAEGTTGLEIRDRLTGHPGVKLMDIEPERRKDLSRRAELLNACDFAVLCLPDAAAREAVALIKNPAVRVIDASTAHRTAQGWVYGLPELSPERRESIKAGGRIANPGCHATGFTALAYPLVAMGLLPRGQVMTCISVTGYSGGGKKMIADYSAADRDAKFQAARPYAMAQTHKHLPEMALHSGLGCAPVFIPVLGDYYKGMAVSLPMHAGMLSKKASAADVAKLYAQYYGGCKFISVEEYDPQAAGPVDPQTQNGTNNMRISVFGNDERLVPTAVFDNLGKGASGAAVQSLNIMAGFDEGAAL